MLRESLCEELRDSRRWPIHCLILFAGGPAEGHRGVREHADGRADAPAPDLGPLRHGVHRRPHRLPRARHDHQGVHAGGWVTVGF